MQDRAAARRRPRDLHEREAQTEAGVSDGAYFWRDRRADQADRDRPHLHLRDRAQALKRHPVGGRREPGRSREGPV